MKNVSASLFGVARFSANNAEEENCTTHAIKKLLILLFQNKRKIFNIS